MSVEGRPICERPAGTEFGAIRPNVGVATGNYPTDKPPSVVVHVKVIIGFEPMVNADGKEVKIKNPTLHVGAFGQTKLLLLVKFHLNYSVRKWVAVDGFKPPTHATYSRRLTQFIPIFVLRWFPCQLSKFASLCSFPASFRIDRLRDHST